jgi:hypothetical protein
MKKQESKKRERERSPNNRTTTGFRISDELWAVLQPLLPVHVNTHCFGGGRLRVPDRDCADAIFYVLRTGCQWQALDMDGAMTKAPLGGEKNWSQSHGSRQERGQTQPAHGRAWGAHWSND